MTTPVAEKFTNWLTKAQKGAVVEYFRGYLPMDGPLGLDRAALEAHEVGVVDLYQKRHGDMDYSYYAIKRRATKGKITPKSLSEMAWEKKNLIHALRNVG